MNKKKNKISTGIRSMFLIWSLVLTLCPVMPIPIEAAAILVDVATYDQFVNALGCTGNSPEEYIYLTADITIGTGLTVKMDKDVNIDLNGHVLTWGEDNSHGDALTLESMGGRDWYLYFSDSSAKKTGKIQTGTGNHVNDSFIYISENNSVTKKVGVRFSGVTIDGSSQFFDGSPTPDRRTLAVVNARNYLMGYAQGVAGVYFTNGTKVRNYLALTANIVNCPLHLDVMRAERVGYLTYFFNSAPKEDKILLCDILKDKDTSLLLERDSYSQSVETYNGSETLPIKNILDKKHTQALNFSVTRGAVQALDTPGNIVLNNAYKMKWNYDETRYPGADIVYQVDVDEFNVTDASPQSVGEGGNGYTIRSRRTVYTDEKILDLAPYIQYYNKPDLSTKKFVYKVRVRALDRNLKYMDSQKSGFSSGYIDSTNVYQTVGELAKRTFGTDYIAYLSTPGSNSTEGYILTTEKTAICDRNNYDSLRKLRYYAGDTGYLYTRAISGNTSFDHWEINYDHSDPGLKANNITANMVIANIYSPKTSFSMEGRTSVFSKSGDYARGIAFYPVYKRADTEAINIYDVTKPVAGEKTWSKRVSIGNRIYEVILTSWTDTETDTIIKSTDIAKNDTSTRFEGGKKYKATFAITRGDFFGCIPSDTEVNIDGMDNVSLERTYNGVYYYTADYAVPLPVTGKITSYGNKAALTTVVLQSETKTYTTSGTTSYTFPAVCAGTYTMTVKKTKHCDRTYTITVGDKAVSQDVKILLYGDVDENGEVTAQDATQINRYVAHMKSIFDNGDSETIEYRKKVASVNGNGEVTAQDATQINRYAAHMKSVFDTLP